MAESVERKRRPILDTARNLAIGTGLFAAGVVVDRQIYADPQIEQLIEDSREDDCTLMGVQRNQAEFLCHGEAAMSAMVRRASGQRTNYVGNFEVVSVSETFEDAYDVTIKDNGTRR